MSENEDVKVVNTESGINDGQNKCPKCGATEISTNINSGKLRCEFCRHEFEPEKLEGMESDISNLTGEVIASGASNIEADSKDVITLKCSSCGAEVVIDTTSSNQARCHWCRNTLSINSQVPNGSVPDVVLPFAVKKEEAKGLIENFVGKRKFFAHPKFKQEFTTANVMGVYFPYMIVDVNGHDRLSGIGEHQTRRYTVSHNDRSTTYYDADAYKVERDFDIMINGLTIESSSDKLNQTNANKTTNIINSIMPFDTENCVKYNANYLKGYTSEKRDTNIEDLKPIMAEEAKDIARFAANDTLTHYDRGVAWTNESFDIKGQQWKSAYLPVWIYSYMQDKGGKKLLHYVAVNARTKETMGSVPIHMPKLIFVSAIIEFLSIFTMFLADTESDYNWIFFLPGIAFYIIMYLRYRNSDARHTYERETKREVKNMQKRDTFLESRKRLTNSRVSGCNNTLVRGANSSKSVVDKIAKNNPILGNIKDNIGKK